MKLKYFFYILLISILLTSCGTERKLARKFISQSTDIAVLVVVPEFIFKFNERNDKNTADLKNLEQYQKDSILVAQTLVLKDVDEAVFLSVLENACVETMKEFNVQAYTLGQFSDFEQHTTSEPWIVNISQVEIQEFNYIEEIARYLYGIRYDAAVPRNGINVASWFEMIPSEIYDNNMVQRLYSEQEMIEEVDGDFRYDEQSNEIYYSYNTDSLSVEKIYNFAAYLGRLYGGYAYDYIMNDYVKKQLPDEKTQTRFFRYNPYTKQLFATESDRFIFLEEK